MTEQDWSDLPSVVSFPVHKRTARKQYDCNNCTKKIEPNQVYYQWPMIVDGEFMMHRVHNEYCWETDDQDI